MLFPVIKHPAVLKDIIFPFHKTTGLCGAYRLCPQTLPIRAIKRRFTWHNFRRLLWCKVVLSDIFNRVVLTLLILFCFCFCFPQAKNVDRLDRLIQELKDKDPIVQRRATGTLGQIKGARAVEPLVAALKDEKYIIRSAAADALGSIGTPAVEHLIVALKDKDLFVRNRAAGALGQIAAPDGEDNNMA